MGLICECDFKRSDCRRGSDLQFKAAVRNCKDTSSGSLFSDHHHISETHAENAEHKRARMGMDSQQGTKGDNAPAVKRATAQPRELVIQW